MAKTRRFKQFTIDEISAVDRPAQVGAKVRLMKRDNSATQEEMQMADDLKKSLEDLQKKYNDLDVKFTTLDTLAKAKDDKITFLSKALALSGAEREYFATLSDAEQAAFVEKSSSERATILKNLADANPVIYTALDGSEYRKNDDGRLVAQVKRNDDMEKRLAKADALAKQHEYSKRAQDELGNITGDDVTKTDFLKAIDTIEDEEKRGKVTKMITALNKVAGMAFQKVGFGGAPIPEGSAEDQLEKLAEAYAKEHKVHPSIAYDKVLNSPQGQEIYSGIYNKRVNTHFTSD